MARKNPRPWQKALKAARVSRGWSYLEAARKIGIGRQQLKNLEGHPEATRPTDPLDIKLSTAMRLIDAYAPDIGLEDLLAGRFPQS